MNTGIYKIEHVASGKKYIGQAVDIKRRLGEHKYSLKAKRAPSVKLQRAWDKYGENAFIFQTLLVCHASDLNMYEQIIMDHYDCVKNGYNILPTAGSCKGHKQTEEHKAKIGAANRGKSPSAEQRKKISETLKGRKIPRDVVEKGVKSRTGGKRTPEQRARMKEAAKKRGITPENRAKMVAGNKYTPERLHRMSVVMLGRKHTEEAKKKISEASKGRKHSPESIAKMRALAKKRSISPETLLKMQESRRINRAKRLAEAGK